MHQKGQAVIILLLIMLVSLTIGLAITQRSLTDISTSNKGEESSRAFSAAEAGIEQALQTGLAPNADLNLGNSASANVTFSNALPSCGDTTVALEYPPIGRETVAQLWLTSQSSSCPGNYGGTSLRVYFGNSSVGADSAETPALEVNVITQVAGVYTSNKYFYDPVPAVNRASIRGADNGFTDPGCSVANRPSVKTTRSDTNQTFRCTATVPPSGSLTGLVMVRARILYSSTPQSVAFGPVGAGVSIPSQAKIITSTGSSGQVQRKVQVFQLPKVVPQIFDYAVFSNGPIQKCDNC
jgi:Tfp pilus assembly protein PilX